MAVTRARTRDEGRAGPARRCIVTGRIAPREALIRFAVAPDGRVVPDLLEVLPGRGLWVAADRKALSAVSQRHFARAAKAGVTVPDGLADLVEAGLAARCKELIGLARRAGAAMCGFEKVRAALRAGKARLLLAASDGASDGRGKVRMLAPDTPLADALTAAELGAAFGRERVVHAAVTDPALAGRIARECARLAGLRGGPGGAAEVDAQVRVDLVNGKMDLA